MGINISQATLDEVSAVSAANNAEPRTTIIIHYPGTLERASDYVKYVAEQVERGYASGHVECGMYWESTEEWT